MEAGPVAEGEPVVTMTVGVAVPVTVAVATAAVAVEGAGATAAIAVTVVVTTAAVEAMPVAGEAPMKGATVAVAMAAVEAVPGGEPVEEEGEELRVYCSWPLSEKSKTKPSKAKLARNSKKRRKENNTLWATIMEEGAFSELVGLPSAVVEDIYRDAQPELAAARRRGPRPKLGWLDHLLVIMMLYKLGTTVGGLAARINVKESTLADAITRIRPILNQTLHNRWWEARSRPKEFAQQGYRHVAALGDSTSLEVHRPGRFEEAKAYWDGKNKIYALKKEVAVMASPPYFALFSSKGFLGSIHDYSHHKSYYRNYLPYLRKTQQEKRALAHDQQHEYWAMVLDKAYVGPPQDTPGLRRITPFKPARTQREKEANLIYIYRAHPHPDIQWRHFLGGCIWFGISAGRRTHSTTPILT
jgi:hypothetical protein